MRTDLTARYTLVLALLAALVAAPAEAQGKGKGKEKDKSRPELVRRDDTRRLEERLREDRKRAEERLREDRKRSEERLRDSRDDDDRWDDDDDRWDDDARRDGRRRDVPPGWCKGKGNPHNTPENCGYGSDRRDGTWSGSRSDSRYDGSSSYDRAHQDFHYDHDRQCRMRAAERPLDLQWQIRVRSECKQRHDDWHARAGRRHG